MKLHFEVLREAIKACFTTLAFDKLNYDHTYLGGITKLYVNFAEKYYGPIDSEDKVDIAHAIAGLMKAGRRINIDVAIKALEGVQQEFGCIIGAPQYVPNPYPQEILRVLSDDAVARAIVAFHKNLIKLYSSYAHNGIFGLNLGLGTHIYFVDYKTYNNVDSLIRYACSAHAFENSAISIENGLDLLNWANDMEMNLDQALARISDRNSAHNLVKNLAQNSDGTVVNADTPKARIVEAARQEALLNQERIHTGPQLEEQLMTATQHPLYQIDLARFRAKQQLEAEQMPAATQQTLHQLEAFKAADDQSSDGWSHVLNETDASQTSGFPVTNETTTTKSWIRDYAPRPYQ